MAILVAIGIAILIILIGPLNVLVGAGVIIIVGILIVRGIDNRRPGIGSYEGSYNPSYYPEGTRWSGPDAVIQAACLAEARRTGRHLGPDVHVTVNRWMADKQTGDFEVWNHAEWLERNGPANGVYISYE